MGEGPAIEWFELRDQVSKEEFNKSALEVVFKDGMLVREQTLAGIRAKIDKAVNYNQ